MLTKTDFSVPKEYITSAVNQIPNIDFRLSINEPTGSFFYDPWIIKEEFKGTIWQDILNSLPGPIGEARLISLSPGRCYQAHADIDDRWHLNFTGTRTFLVDIDSQEMYPLIPDSCWYVINAGKLHSAINFGRTDRVQLVVRMLLKDAMLHDSVPVKIVAENLTEDHARYVFDSTISPWLNFANKRGIMNNFNYSRTHVSFNLERQAVKELEQHLPENFKLL